ncbi:MAG: ATP-dependent helicase [Flavobacterium sp.]|nr:MAG: ATP-dependent helicase [Flavobacterium sp.]
MSRPAFSIYDASAGSGKTYTLVKEYLQIILSAPGNDSYRNILAITFTNKAVHEMKSRVIDSLSAFSSDEPNEKALALMCEIECETGIPVDRIKSKSKEIIRHIIHNYAAFDISTIDKFTHRVIRAFAHDLGLPVTFEVSLDTEALLSEAVDALIAKAGEDEVLTKLLVDFTMEKTDDDRSWDISREIFETGKLILNENNRKEIVHFKEKTISEFTEIRKKLIEACSGIEAECTEFADAALNLLAKSAVDLASFSAGNFPKHLNFIKNNELKSTHKKYFEPEDIRINKNARDRDVIEQLTPELLQILAQVYKNHQKRDFYQAFLKNITPLSLLNIVGQELANLQKEQQVLSIAEFNKLINDEIQNQPAPFIYERMGERYRHFFIDEFQDTSEMQWLNLIPLIDNALSSQDMSGNAGSLMIVGDPKQSIYRWRGGKAEQFIALAGGVNPFNNPDRQLFALDTNYRSFRQVVDFNNDFFKYLATHFTHADYRDLYANRCRQKDCGKEGGYVNLSFIDPAIADDEESDDKTALYLKATISTIHRVLAEGFALSDIVVLTRKREQGVAVAAHLTENEIPILSSETLLIANSDDVRFIVDCLKFLRNANDRESLANLLRFVAERTVEKIGVHDFIAGGLSKKDDLELESWLADNGVSLSFARLRKKTLYESAETIIDRCIPEKRSSAYVQYFLDIVLERDMKANAGISDFLQYWEKNAEKLSIPSPEEANAIRIMTIHKSKGLEFPVVIFPFADEDYSRKVRDKIWLDFDEETFSLPRVLIDNNGAVETFGDEASESFRQKKQEELLDNINLLYVALTRAEEQLFVISAMNLNKYGEIKQGTASSFFLNYLEQFHLFDPKVFNYKFGERKRVSKARAIPKQVNEIQPVNQLLDTKSIKIARRESLMWGTTQQEAIEYGNVVHEVLSHVRTAADIELAIEKALEDGIITSLQQDAVRMAIQEVTSHPELAGFFDGKGQLYNEQVIVRPGQPTVKPDRILISENDAWILDYKTGAHNPKYAAQLDGYATALADMGYLVTKKTLAYLGEEVKVINL